MKPDFLFPTDEDLELKKPKLFQFKAEPEVITPIGASTLSWQTDAEGTLSIELPAGRKEVAQAGSLVVRPKNTNKYKFWQGSGRFGTVLGTETVTVDHTGCKTDGLVGIGEKIKKWVEQSVESHIGTGWDPLTLSVLFDEDEVTVESLWHKGFNVGSTVRFGLGVADGQIESDLHSEFSGADAYYGAATAMLFGTVIRTSLRIFAQWPNALVPAGRIVATVEIPEDSTGVGYINWEHCDDPFVAETVDQFMGPG